MKTSFVLLVASIGLTAGCDTDTAVESISGGEPGFAATDDRILGQTCVNSVGAYAGLPTDTLFAGNTSSLGSGASTYVFQSIGTGQWICRTNATGKVVLIKGSKAGEV